MSNVGIIMLVHTALDRAEQVARHWARAGCPVVIHVDANVPRKPYKRFVAALQDISDLKFTKRYHCEWGTWNIVEASQVASEVMLSSFPDVQHVYLASGSCLPIRPVSELMEYLAARPYTDFIESATISDVRWTVGGLQHERFTLRFPFSWKRQRKIFDFYVALQRCLRIRRKIPGGLVIHMGSQWWCLTRQTLSAILYDPDRKAYNRYFRKVWIPDESCFQTLVRQYSTQIESRSLTLSKFDFQGKPHIFYDDHLQLLRRSDCFVARKIWSHADRLYEVFLNESPNMSKRIEPNPGKIDRIFAKALERRLRGRAGLYMQSRLPGEGHENGMTAAPYSVFCGFTELFHNFEPWLAKITGAQVHGHLFGSDRAHFSNNQKIMNGALSDSPILRDYNPNAFLTSLIWNTRGERQIFQYGPADTQKINWLIAKDPNAQISVISGAWIIPLFLANKSPSEIRNVAARFQKTERKFIDILQSPWTKARFRIWAMAEFIEAPMEPLQTILDEIGPNHSRRLAETPKMVHLHGFGQFLQNLKNQGMHPYLMGDFLVEPDEHTHIPNARKPYLVR